MSTVFPILKMLVCACLPRGPIIAMINWACNPESTVWERIDLVPAGTDEGWKAAISDTVAGVGPELSHLGGVPWGVMKLSARLVQRAMTTGAL